MINSETDLLILVGDDQQLPPVVREQPGRESGIAISALERLSFAKSASPATAE